MKLNWLFVDWIFGILLNILIKVYEINMFVYYEYFKFVMMMEIDFLKFGSYELFFVCKVLLDYRDMYILFIWRFNDGRKVMVDWNDFDWYLDYMFGN